MCVVILCVLYADGVVAQHGAGPGTLRSQARRTVVAKRKREEPEIVRIRKLTGLRNQDRVKTPEYRTNVARGTRPDREWVRIAVTYDTAPEWIDELTFQYHVLSVMMKDGKKSYSLFKSTVRYGDIEKGRKHVSTMFLRPSVVRRFGELIALAVEISHKGKVVDEKSEVLRKMPEKWWENPLVLESPDITVRNGYLLNRTQSPFAFINMDDHEFIK